MQTIYLDDRGLNKRKIKKLIKKIYRINKKEEIVLALCKELENNDELNCQINYYGFKILNGRWLFKFLLPEALEYIIITKNLRPETMNIAILMDCFDEIIVKQIPQIALQFKTVKIITETNYRFLYLEKEMYNRYGIAIQITNNKVKSLLNTDIIINFDFSQNSLNKYNINSHAIIINMQGAIKIMSSDFCGTNINDYEIEYDEENMNIDIDKTAFEHNILYESYIYRKDTFENIKRQMKADDVKILNLA